MYAIVRDRGRQYKVREGDLLRVDRLELAPGAAVTFEEVLLLGRENEVKVGAPAVAGARVRGVLEAHALGEKLVARRRMTANKRTVRHGHRSQYSLVKIEKIEG